MIKLLSLLVVLVLLAILGAVLLIIVAAPFAWMAIAFMAYCRPRVVLSRVTTCFFLIWVVSVLLLPVGNGALIGMLLAIFLAPAPGRWWASSAAFHADDLSRREAAVQVRNLQLEREGTMRRVSAARRWRDYLIDAERAQRGAAYLLPLTPIK